MSMAADGNTDREVPHKRLNIQDDADSLQFYYRQLAESEPLTAEEEYALWEQIDICFNRVRGTLYTFGFVLQEHIRILQDRFNSSNLSDFFPASSFPDAADSSRGPDTAIIKVKPWLREIEALSQELKEAFDGKKIRMLPALRKKSAELLNRHPVCRDKLLEWYDVACAYRKECLEGGGSSDLRNRKLCMDDKTFLREMSKLDGEFEAVEEMRQKMVTCNLRLVVSIVHHYRRSSVQTADMIQEGNLGLIRAIDKFDHKLGHKFSTYATWWIKQAVSRTISSQSRVIRLPAHMIATIVRINRAEQDFLQRNGRMPTDTELAVQLEMPRERISAIKKMTCQTISLQAPIADDNDKNLLENLLCDPDTTDPARQMTSKLLLENLKDAIDRLPEREQQIIRMRYGLDSQPPKTLLEVSRFFNLTRERIRQIEMRAIRHLRNPSLETCYQDYYFER